MRKYQNLTIYIILIINSKIKTEQQAVAATVNKLFSKKAVITATVKPTIAERIELVE